MLFVLRVNAPDFLCPVFAMLTVEGELMTEREMTILIQTLLFFVKEIHEGKPMPEPAAIHFLLRTNKRELEEHPLP